MKGIDDIKRLYEQAGAVLIRVEWFEADGVVSKRGTDFVVPILVLTDHAIGWISCEDIKPHAYRFDRTSIDCDDVFLVGDDRQYRVVVSPMWLPEQRAQAADFHARVVVPEQMRAELDEFVRQADEG